MPGLCNKPGRWTPQLRVKPATAKAVVGSNEKMDLVPERILEVDGLTCSSLFGSRSWLVAHSCVSSVPFSFFRKVLGWRLHTVGRYSHLISSAFEPFGGIAQLVER